MASEQRAEIWTEPLARVLDRLTTGPDGLGTAEARRRRRLHGPNVTVDRHRRPWWRQLLERLANPLTLILLFASALSAATGEVTGFVLISIILTIGIGLDLAQEVRAERAVDALRRSVALRATVRRAGHEHALPVEALVPGDVVRLAAGDIVPADCRLLTARDLFVDQAMLTGESYPAEKHAAELERPASGPDGALNTVFMGSSVTSGTATAVVCRTGKETAIGGLAATLASRRPPDSFQIGIRRFGGLVLRLTVLLVLFVLAVNTVFERPWLESLLFALALAVGLTPELLPMVVTVTLAGGARRLAAARVIVKRLGAIQGLGAMDVLCTDKTGTLTEAKIRLVRHLDPAGQDSERVLELAYLNSAFETGIRSPLDEAILAVGARDLTGWRKIDEVPFDFERRRVSVLVERTGVHQLVVKGAPEDTIRLSTTYETADGPRPLDEPARRALLDRFEALGEEGFRVLGIASRPVAAEQRDAVVDDESELVFAGFAVFLDPPKAGAAEALRALGAAGVAVKVLTGDNERVTRHVCRELGLDVSRVVTGEELVAMSEEALMARVREVDLFCRVTPQQKQRVLAALTRTGQVAGFLGDGINDAAALHTAEVGISVDSAVDVAKEAADLVLLDHDLRVLHAAVLEGRRTVENVTKYILMASSSNFGNIFSMAGAALFLPFLPMQPVQVLLNNLLYDGSELGLPLDRVDQEALAHPTVLDLGLIRRCMLVLGPLSSLFDFLTFAVMLHVFAAGETLFQTGWFVESLATQVLVVFVVRTRHRPWRSRPHPALSALALTAIAIGALLPLSPLGPLLGFVPPPPAFYLFIAVATLAYLSLVELVKSRLFRPSGPNKRPPVTGGPLQSGATTKRNDDDQMS